MSDLFTRILVAVDDSEPAKAAVALGARLAREHDGRLLLCSCVNWIPLIAEVEATGAAIDPNPIIDGLKKQGDALLEQAATVAAQIGAAVQTRSLEGEPGERIPAFAAEEHCGLIVMGTHGRHGLGRMFLGSTTEAVLRSVSIPVLTVRPGLESAPQSRRCFERVVVGVDDSEPSDAAVETVCALPPEDRRRLVFYSVADVDTVIGARGYYYAQILDDLRARSRQIVDRAVETARARGVAAEGRIADGSAAEVLIAAAGEDAADLIVLGSHGRRGLQRFFLGSVAEDIVRRAPVPVLVVRTKG